MSNFLTDLWSSVFTPGPTPTLLLATNVTFLALQLLLFILLIATYSIHFLILSFLSAGLWGSINWFAKELVAAQKKDDFKKKQRHDESEKENVTDKELLSHGTDGSESENMLEKSRRLSMRTRSRSRKGVDEDGKRREKSATPKATSREERPQDGEVRARATTARGSGFGEGSTDSEWEKLEHEH